jgi:hypothetical protein
MKSGRGFLDVFDNLIDRLLCVVGAGLFSQGPEFMQQYLQRLGGHLDEARRQLAVFQQTAAQAGVSLEKFITQIGSSADPAMAKLGAVMSGTAERVASLQLAHDTLLSAPLWERPVVFLHHLDLDIARATGAVYKPAVPTTTEGLIYALAGLLVFLALYHIGFKYALARFSRRAAASKHPARSVA